MKANGITLALVQRLQKDMECLADGIREELDNATRAEAMIDRVAALNRIASLSKRLRSACNRTVMELQRTNNKTP